MELEKLKETVINNIMEVVMQEEDSASTKLKRIYIEIELNKVFYEGVHQGIKDSFESIRNISSKWPNTK